MPDGGDKTYRALFDWMGSQKESERMCAQLMAIEGYTSLDPSHPLGGPDGSKDAIMYRNDQKWIMAVSFSRKQVTLNKLIDKFREDCAGINKNHAIGIAFCTNQQLTNTELTKVEKVAPPGVEVEIFHLERIRDRLDQPKCYGIRLQFLDIEMSKADQLGFIASLEAERYKHLAQALTDQNTYLTNIITGGNTFLSLGVVPNPDQFTIRTHGEFPMLSVSLKVQDFDLYTQIGMEIASKTRDMYKVNQATNRATVFNCKFERLYTGPNTEQALNFYVPEIKPLEQKTYLFSWEAANGTSTGFIYLRRTADGTLKVIKRVRRPDGTKFEQPKDYPKIDDAAAPDWNKL